MYGDAKIFIKGTVLSDPSVKQINDKSVMNLSVAVRTSRKQENSKYYESDRYSVAVWDQRSQDRLSSELKKGARVYVSGVLEMRTWTNRNNEKTTTPTIMAEDIELIAKTRSSGTRSQEHQEPETDDNEVPF